MDKTVDLEIGRIYNYDSTEGVNVRRFRLEGIEDNRVSILEIPNTGDGAFMHSLDLFYRNFVLDKSIEEKTMCNLKAIIGQLILLKQTNCLYQELVKLGV